VRPVARGTGVATHLLSTVLDTLADEGLETIRLETLPADMPAAVRIYERAGFVTVPATTDCPGLVTMELRPDPSTR
jgi:ribosomal protein S18 acetylase RimI-like enzyme